MKKTIAAVLAVLCVMGTSAVTSKLSAEPSVTAITASAATTEVGEPGVNAYKYQYEYADTTIYTHTISMVTNASWKADDGNTYGIYKITVTGMNDNGKKETLLTEYRVGLKTIFNTELDVDIDAMEISSKAEELFEEQVAAKAKEEVELLDPGKVTVIGDSAFKGSYLKSIDGLDNIEYIGKAAFQNCTYFTEVTIPESVKFIGESAFEKSGMKTMIVNNDMPVIPDSFCASTNLTNITFAHPEFIRVIGKNSFKATPMETPFFQNWNDVEGYEMITINDSAFEACTSIKSVKTSDNISIMGKKVFKGCTSLSEITFGSGLLGADESCFEGCVALSTINFNDKLEALGGGAFKDCTSLQYVSGFPDTIENWTPYGSKVGWGFGNSMFYGCTSLIAVDFPPSVTVIPDSTFYGCTSLTAVYKSGESERVDGTVSDPSITLIDNSAFEGCTGIRVVNYPNATRLGDKAFKGCSSMENFGVGVCKGVTATIDNKEQFLPGVGENALEGCSKLKAITLLSDSYVKDVTDAKKNKGYTFKDCTSATLITVNTAGMTKTPDGFFSGCTSLKLVNDPAQSAFQDVSIVSPSTFENCTSLEKINIPNVRILEDSAFAGCTNLTSISNSENAIKAEDYGLKCFQGCESLKIKVTGDIYTIGASAFQASGITEVDIAGMTGGTVVIDASAFADCLNLTNAKIMSGNAALFSVGDGLFSNSTALKTVTYEGNIITKNMFKGCTLLNKIMTNATSIKTSAFEGCVALKSVMNLNDTASVTAADIGSAAFKNCTVLTGIPADLTTVYDGKENYFGCEALESVQVNALTEGMFAGCTGLKSVELLDVNAVPKTAFQNCTSLESFDLSNMQSIGANAFSGAGLKEVLIKNASSVGNSAFMGCTNLTSIDVTATTIEKAAFQNDTALTSIKINTATIGDYAFSGCSALEAAGLEINQAMKAPTLTSVGANAFTNCLSLKSIAIPDNPKIGTKAFGFNSKKVDDFIVAGIVSINDEDSNTKVYADKNGFEFVDIFQYDPGEPSTPQTPSETTPSGGSLKKGDADGDGNVNILDVIEINRAVLGKIVLKGDNFTAADVSGDGVVDATDSLTILKYLVNIIDSL